MALRICYFGTYEADYERNRILTDALESNGVEILRCHEDLWSDRRHKTGALEGGSALGELGARVARSYARLAQRYLAIGDHDLVFVGYLGHLDMLLAAPLARLRGKPVVFDAFISLYDTLVFDRAIFPANSVQARAAKLLDRLSCALADRVLLDTDSHIDYFANELRVARSKCRRVLVGAQTDIFHPVPHSEGGPFTALHYSKFAPLHGIHTILEAAALLAHEPDIRFHIVGGGQLEREVVRAIEASGLTNLVHTRWMEPSELRTAIAGAGACLGIFGDTPKASRVIPNKVYQCMAVGAPIVTRDSPGIRELLQDGRDAILVPPADARALADAVLRLARDRALGKRLAVHARALFAARCSTEMIGRDLVRELEDLA
jgi:glycosyltransferase involved in cell wall biosynthesis